MESNWNIFDIRELQYLLFSSSAMADSGSWVTMMRQSVFEKLKHDPDLKSGIQPFKGFGNVITSALGSFDAILEIQDDVYDVECFVVKDEYIDYDMIVGLDIINQTHFTMIRGKVIMKKLSEEDENDDNFISKVKVVNCVVKVNGSDLNNIQDEQSREVIKEPITNNIPKKPEKSCVEMKVSLTDGMPVYEKPRRKSPKEKDGQVLRVKQMSSVIGNFVAYILVNRKEGVSRGNDQVELMNGIFVPILTKITSSQPEKWYRYNSRLKTVMNSMLTRSTGKTPFELLFGVKMRIDEDLDLAKQLEEALQADFQERRQEMRNIARENISKLQEENRKSYNRNRKPALKYKVGDLVAIQRTQLGGGLKLKGKFLGPYEVTQVKRNDRYGVIKVGQHEGPNITSTAADLMKPWFVHEDDASSSSSGADD